MEEGSEDRRGDLTKERVAVIVEETIQEKQRKVNNMREMLLEAIRVAHSEYGISFFYHLRKRILQSRTEEELTCATQMMVLLSKFYDLNAD